ncbi:oligosaccharide flippase family protein [Methylocapsa palsarum]|uniref:Membrane protein involved in the export of O-antigen and teichoic acid n=1 Tax=Methylocapsa palsarum TaxID=1612308 RepID=A0A1I4C7M9_9HYPH|nr:oligosaccharide flippase family protein [Methylocapsa palsarum]SFK77124.1 Membrane protein involved in the export of O-antigen and teichoic acid [Methylocapsa palsarum]
MSRIHRSILFSAGERYGSFIFFFFSIAILSRLLTPEQTGIYTAIAALTALANTPAEFGGAGYIIQKQVLSEPDIRTAFTINFAISAAVAAALFLSRDAIATFYGLEGLKDGIGVSALSFLLLPFSSTISALLRREMAFDTVAQCNLVANFVTAATSVALAASGAGFMGPVIGTVAGNAALVALFIAFQRNLRIFLPSFVGYRDVIAFGAYSSGVAIINVFYQMSPQLILGRVLNFTAVGLYGRAISVTQIFDKLIMQVLGPVIMPAIFDQTRAGGDLKQIYLVGIELLSAVQWPFLIFLAFMAEPIVLIWLGPQWIQIVTLVQFICVASLSLFAASLTYPVLVAVGRVRDSLVSSFISLPPSLLMILIASFFSVQAVAFSTLFALPLQAGVAIYFISQRLDIRPAELLRATAKSAIVAGCCTAAILLGIFISNVSGSGRIAELIGVGLLGVMGWLAGLFLTGHPLWEHICWASNKGWLAASQFFLRDGAIPLKEKSPPAEPS